MNIAIHQRANSYSDEWIEYCRIKGIPFKIVDCYKSNIVDQLRDCDALLWHFHHAIPADILISKQLLFSLESTGKLVFPDFNTMWHFDDKIGQKYLLEAIDAPIVPSYVFYSKIEALEWIETTVFPKVFKLRSGAGSHNVKLVKSKHDAIRMIKQAFGKGFNQYNAWLCLRETISNYKLGISGKRDILKSIIRLGYKTEFEKFSSNEKGYIYFQDFIPGNDSDIRIVVVDGKALGFKRLVRENDFRASGCKVRVFDKEMINDATLRIAFNMAQKLNLQTVAFDFIYNGDQPLVIEISYGTTSPSYKPCPGYWDTELNFHEGEVNFCGWMIDKVVQRVNEKAQAEINQNI